MGVKEQERVREKILQLYEEVRKEAKSKVPESPIDKPTVRVKPPSDAVEKKRKKKKARGEVVIEGPVTTLKELAYQFNTDGKAIRRALRKGGFKKPGGRWEWASDGKDLKRIKKFLKLEQVDDDSST